MVFSGTLACFSLAQPATLAALIPDLWVRAWGLMAVIGGAVGIVAAWWPDAITGLLLERIGLAGFGGACAIYGGVLLVVAHPAGLASGCLMISVSLACVWRIRHIKWDLLDIKTKVKIVQKLGDDHA